MKLVKLEKVNNGDLFIIYSNRRGYKNYVIYIKKGNSFARPVLDITSTFNNNNITLKEETDPKELGCLTFFLVLLKNKVFLLEGDEILNMAAELV